MKLMRTTMTRGEKDGAIQMFNGNIGCSANLYSHVVKMAKKRTDAIKSTIS